MSAAANLPYGTISVAREIAAGRDLVFAAWTQLDHRRQWFAGPEWSEVHRELDFRVGGGEVAHGRFPNGIETVYTSSFRFIEPAKRLIYTFDMHVDGTPHSFSLAGVSFADVEHKTLLTYTEQAFFLADGYGEEGRLEGTNFLIDQLTAYLATVR